jgi:hypothetical protein
MSLRALAATGVAVVLALAPVPSASAHAAADKGGHHGGHKDKATASTTFYANDSAGALTAITWQNGSAKRKELTRVASPVWWRTFYLTPTAAAGAWVVGVLSGGQSDTVDAPRLFAFDPATGTLHWLTKASVLFRSPVVTAAKKPKVFYLAGATVREASTSGGHDHRVYSAPHGDTITALTVAGGSAPYIALTRTTGILLPTSTTSVVQLTPRPKTVIASGAGSVTALALSPDAKTLAVSRVKSTGDSVLTLSPQARGGLQRTLPNVGTTSQLSWSGDGRTLAVDPQQWGGWTLVTVANGTTSYPSELQPYGGGVFAPGSTASGSGGDARDH